MASLATPLTPGDLLWWAWAMGIARMPLATATIV